MVTVDRSCLHKESAKLVQILVNRMILQDNKLQQKLRHHYKEAESDVIPEGYV